MLKFQGSTQLASRPSVSTLIISALEPARMVSLELMIVPHQTTPQEISPQRNTSHRTRVKNTVTQHTRQTGISFEHKLTSTRPLDMVLLSSVISFGARAHRHIIWAQTNTHKSLPPTDARRGPLGCMASNVISAQHCTATRRSSPRNLWVAGGCGYVCLLLIFFCERRTRFITSSFTLAHRLPEPSGFPTPRFSQSS